MIHDSESKKSLRNLCVWTFIMRQSQISLSCPGLGEEEGEALGRTAFLGGGIDHHIYSSWVMRSTPFFFLTKIWMGRCLIHSFGAGWVCHLAFGQCDEVGLMSKDVKSYRWNNVYTLKKRDFSLFQNYLNGCVTSSDSPRHKFHSWLEQWRCHKVTQMLVERWR